MYYSVYSQQQRERHQHKQQPVPEPEPEPELWGAPTPIDVPQVCAVWGAPCRCPELCCALGDPTQ
eukprot:COSAG01_NODE_14808_length_1407_cov_3.201835_1_plen_64_part_10